ncbi:hypothetical protein MMF93_27985 [Streptomyces tubbatahanensis]|uniref:Uncharacterized protein n=1 Tax=Streptomyces tubbatahanensis TaxID=2923272 RepID=A0ABY3XZV7_9ACTN|nr:hypothetical protein [Streptomyces tubbatahanensis]UNS99864.1 hypothetical protein MMF93_27985 [Streptomyces tubbatahanensis]
MHAENRRSDSALVRLREAEETYERLRGALAEDGMVRLVRPGGPAWWAESGDLRAATRAEVISVKVATANHRWGL